MYALQSYTVKSAAASVSSNHRRVILTFKERKDVNPVTKAVTSFGKPSNIFYDIPITKISVTPQDLTPALQDAFFDLQQKKIKSLVMEKYDWTAKIHRKNTIMQQEIDVAAIVLFAAATASGRLSEEAIESWFDTAMVLPLATRIATKNHLEPTSDAVIDGVASFRAHFAKLSSTRANIPEALAKQLLKVLDVLELDEGSVDPMKEALVNKLTPFAAPTSAVLSLNI